MKKLLLILLIASACKKQVATNNSTTKVVNITNSGFESVSGWTLDSCYYITNAGDTVKYKAMWGFRLRDIAKLGDEPDNLLGLNFYVPQPGHTSDTIPNWVAPDQTPFSGRFFQTVNVKDGNYKLQCRAEKLGDGMYLWADGGAGEVKKELTTVLPTRPSWQINSLTFTVKGGKARIGFKCINADANAQLLHNAPWFHGDNMELIALP
jgi:hypothetical protein